jgi:hypothetical protein
MKCITLLLFWGVGPKRMHLLRIANVPKRLVIGPVSVDFFNEKKRKKKTVGAPNELIT